LYYDYFDTGRIGTLTLVGDDTGLRRIDFETAKQSSTMPSSGVGSVSYGSGGGSVGSSGGIGRGYVAASTTPVVKWLLERVVDPEGNETLYEEGGPHPIY
jgi:hypothetical protein